LLPLLTSAAVIEAFNATAHDLQAAHNLYAYLLDVWVGDDHLPAVIVANGS
jgi:hypothetical protein